MVRKYLFYVLLCVTTQTLAKDQAVPMATICKILDPEIVYNFTCTTKHINRTTTVRSQDITFQPDVVLNNLYVKIQLNRQFGKIYRPFMINSEQDFCALVSENGIESIINKMLNVKGRNRFGNWYHPCPISGRRYEVDVPMDISKMPGMAVAGNYRVDLIGFTLIDGVRKDFRLTQHFGEFRPKSRKG